MITHCSSLLFWFRCLHDPVSHHDGPVWLPSALHGVYYWAVHSFRSRACFRQNVSVVQRWVTLQAEGSAHVRLTNTWWVYLQFHILFFEFCKETVYFVVTVLDSVPNITLLYTKPMCASSQENLLYTQIGWERLLNPDLRKQKEDFLTEVGVNFLYCERLMKMWLGIDFFDLLKEFDSNIFL